MLDSKDLELFRQIMKEEIGNSEERTAKRITAEIASSEERTAKRITAEIASSEERTAKRIKEEITSSEERTAKRIAKSETLLLNELTVMQNYLEKQINQVQDNLGELRQYYKITKLESDNTTILLRMIEDVSKRLSVLEKIG